MKNTNLRKLLLCVMYSSILFIQELTLSFIPGFQLSFLLILIIGGTLGLKWGNFVLFIYLTLDNLSFGSFMPYVIIPMIIGWEFTLLMGYLFRNKNKFILAAMGIVSCLVYCWSYLPFSKFFFKVDIISYLISDITYEILLSITTFITIIFLYNPLKTIIAYQWNEFDKN